MLLCRISGGANGLHAVRYHRRRREAGLAEDESEQDALKHLLPDVCVTHKKSRPEAAVAQFPAALRCRNEWGKLRMLQ